MIRPNLLAWQWSDYPAKHRDRVNLLLHVVAVPLFLAGTLLLIGAALRRSGLGVGLGLGCLALAVVVEGRGHARARDPDAVRGPARLREPLRGRAVDHVPALRPDRRVEPELPS